MSAFASVRNNSTGCAACIPMRRRMVGVLSAAVVALTGINVVDAKPKALPPLQQLNRDVSFLASDKAEGRGINTTGLERAGDYVREQFFAAGLKPVPGTKSYFQPFEHQSNQRLSDSIFLRANGQELWWQDDYTVTTASAAGTFDAPLVFAGYGITAPDRGYDDYAGIDVTGKVVLVLRYEPMHTTVSTTGPAELQHAPAPVTLPGIWIAPSVNIATVPEIKTGSRLAETGKWSEHAALNTKLANAAKHGAAGVLIVNPIGAVLQDILPSSESGGPASFRSSIPFAYISRDAADDLLAQAGEYSLAQLQAQIDETFLPLSAEIPGVTVQGNIAFESDSTILRNVMGYLPGKGTNAGQVIVIGAHYDHLGRGGYGSLLPGSTEIHNGADDNASGTAALLQVARTLAAGEPLERSILFVAFSGEEQGLLGSFHFVSHCPVPRENIVAMLNLDMVGRVREDVLYVGGIETAAGFKDILDRANKKTPLMLKPMASLPFGASDHLPFIMEKIPAIFLFSGLHEDYHRPTDDIARINFNGLVQVSELATTLTRELAAMPRPDFVQSPELIIPPGLQPSRPALGVVPDYGTDTGNNGVRIARVTPSSPADVAGLQAGDVITALGDQSIGNLNDLTRALGSHQPGDRVRIKVLRNGEAMEAEATLTARTL